MWELDRWVCDHLITSVGGVVELKVEAKQQ